jgi:hypothetical protein
VPRELDRAEHALGVRHHDREAAVGCGERRDPSGRAVGVRGVRRRDVAVAIDEPRGDELRLLDRRELLDIELGAAFAVRVRDRDARAGHASEEQRRRLLQLDEHDARLELLRAIAHEPRPMPRARDDVREIRERLTAVAHTEEERVRARGQLREHVLRACVVAERRRPAAARAEDIAEREPATRDGAAAVGEIDATFDEVGHVDVDRVEAGARERGGHLDLTVDALLAQDRDLRARGHDRGRV